MQTGRRVTTAVLAALLAVACGAPQTSNSPAIGTIAPTPPAGASAQPTETSPADPPTVVPSHPLSPSTPTARPEPPDGAPIAAAPIEGRFGHAGAWTDKEVVLVGGQRDYGSEPFDDGAAYDPKTGEWRRIAPFPLGPRTGATAMWTGSEVIVWGGNAGGEGPVIIGDGAAYDPVADAWRTLPLPGADRSSDIWYEAVWTGIEMLIWGGRRSSEPLSAGASYDPSTDGWRDISAGPLSPRFNHSMIWTGTEVIVWGGNAADDSEQPLADGAAYDPSTDRWRVIARGPLEPRSGHVAVWTDDPLSADLMLIWSGRGANDALLATGALYSPKTDGWRPIDAAPIAPRHGATAVSTGRAAIIWGGVDQPPPRCVDGVLEDNPYAACDGVQFDPHADQHRGQWFQLHPGPLSPRSGHTATWARGVMVIWGGLGADGRPLADGAVYAERIQWLSEPLAPTERAESDEFWESLIPMHCPFPEWYWESLEAMTADVELVVSARVVGVQNRYDRRYKSNVAVITFAIDEVVKGEPMSRVDGTVDLISYGGEPDHWHLKANVPDGKHLLFLMNSGEAEAESGRQPTDDDRNSYFLPNHQAVIRELDGLVSLFEEQDDGPDNFPYQLHDRPFDEVVNEVREMVSRTPPTSTRPVGVVLARLSPTVPDPDRGIVMAC